MVELLSTDPAPAPYSGTELISDLISASSDIVSISVSIVLSVLSVMTVLATWGPECECDWLAVLLPAVLGPHWCPLCSVSLL